MHGTVLRTSFWTLSYIACQRMRVGSPSDEVTAPYSFAAKLANGDAPRAGTAEVPARSTATPTQQRRRLQQPRRLRQQTPQQQP